VKNLSIRELTTAGLVASLYTVLSLAFQPISFGVYQIRIAEALTVLPFLVPAAIPGLYIGCLLANVLGNMGWLDIVVGPLLTLVAAFLTWRTALFQNSRLNLRLAVIPLIFMWLGAVYLLSGFAVELRTIIGVVASLASFCVLLIGRSLYGTDDEEYVSEAIWSRFIGALILALLSVYLLRTTSDTYFIVCGGLLIIMTVAGVAMLIWTSATGRNPNLLLAPLPPVLLNAFGVSIYLAPIMGTDYWFAVQMIGVGQLIACYLIGLPLLLVLTRRRLFE